MIAAREVRSYAELRALARQRLPALGLEPPLDLEALRRALEIDRGEAIVLVPTDELPPGSAFGVTGSRAGVAVVLYESRTTKSHQQLIVLHEYAHMLLRHPASHLLHVGDEVPGFREIEASTVAEALGLSPPAVASPNLGPHCRGRWRRAAHRTRRSGQDTVAPGGSLHAGAFEHEAETLATILLGWVPGHSAHVEPRPSPGLAHFLSDHGAW